MKKAILRTAILASLFVSPFVFGATDAESDVRCTGETNGAQVKISTDGRVTSTSKEGKTTIIPFSNCRLTLSGPITAPEKSLSVYVCESPGVASKYMLEQNNAGYFNLIEQIDLRGKWTINNSNQPASGEVQTFERKLGTFKCTEPAKEAWMAQQRKSLDAARAQPAAPAASGTRR